MSGGSLWQRVSTLVNNMWKKTAIKNIINNYPVYTLDLIGGVFFSHPPWNPPLRVFNIEDESARARVKRKVLYVILIQIIVEGIHRCTSRNPVARDRKQTQCRNITNIPSASVYEVIHAFINLPHTLAPYSQRDWGYKKKQTTGSEPASNQTHRHVGNFAPIHNQTARVYETLTSRNVCLGSNGK